MAVKKILADGYSYEDLFDTQEALDSGSIASSRAGTTTTNSVGKGWLNKGDISGEGTTTGLYANKDTLGSILGMTDAIAANKKRKKEQTMTGNAGFGASNSILGGGGF